MKKRNKLLTTHWGEINDLLVHPGKTRRQATGKPPLPETAQGKWFSHTMHTHKVKLLTKVALCPDKTVNIAVYGDIWQQDKQTNNAFSVASYNHRS